MKDFQLKNPGGIIQSIEFNTEILTNGHWPEQNAGACSLPPELSICTKKFEEFYKYRH
jgi:hypothetical protein